MIQRVSEPQSQQHDGTPLSLTRDKAALEVCRALRIKSILRRQLDSVPTICIKFERLYLCTIAGTNLAVLLHSREMG